MNTKTLFVLFVCVLSACTDHQEPSIPEPVEPEPSAPEEPSAPKEPSNTPAEFSGVLSAEITSKTDSYSSTAVVSDPDANEAEFTPQSNIEVNYGAFSIAANGEWQYVLNQQHSDVLSLPAQQVLIDTISIQSIDGSQTELKVTILGVNTPAFFSGDLTAQMTNQDSTTSGKIEITDVNLDEEKLLAQTDITTEFGQFSIDTEGNWQYELQQEHPQVAELVAGSTPMTEQISVSSIDGTNAHLVITITAASSRQNGFTFEEGGNHIDGYTDAVPEVNCSQIVQSISALEDAADSLSAGDTLCLAEGNYSGDLSLRIEGLGTATQPITVAAETPGSVVISQGEMSVRMGGEHIVLQGFVFRDGESGSSIIKLENSSECHYCRVTEVSIIDMDNGDYSSSKWLEYYGQYNRIDHNWFSGKESRGALLVLPRWIDEDTFNSSGFKADHAQIDHNYFGERPPAFGRAYAASSDNEYEAVRLGLSTTHSAPSYSVLEHNYFERIQGEAEVISNKSAGNTIRYNTVRESHGAIVNRHGNESGYYNNFIFGDNHPFSGGIRISDDNIYVGNNYIEGARYQSSNWNGGIVLTSGDNAGDTENGYQNVYAATIRFNTIVDSVNSLNIFGGKENVAPKDLTIANNVIAKAIGPVVRTNNNDLPSNSNFAANYVFGSSFSDNENLNEQMQNTGVSGFNFIDSKLSKTIDGLYRPSENSPELSAEINGPTVFGSPNLDMDGQIRTESTIAGADEPLETATTLSAKSAADVGPKSYRPEFGRQYVQRIAIQNFDFDFGDLTGWQNEGGVGAEVISGDAAFSRDFSLRLNDNSAQISQTLTLNAHTNYTLSAFVKGTAKLAVIINEQTYSLERSSSDYGFSSVSFNSGEATQAKLVATVDDEVTKRVELINADFDDGQNAWVVAEGTGIGQVQDSSNSAAGADGSIKFKWNIGEDTGTPHQPYIAQTVAVLANTDYELSIYNLNKSSNDNSSIIFGVATSEDITDTNTGLPVRTLFIPNLRTMARTKAMIVFTKTRLALTAANKRH